MTTAPADPELSVVIPAYNAAGTLGTQLDALAAQRPSWPWEVLVCDNGSTDGTRELVLATAARMPELRLVDASERRGPSAARNIGARHARGPLLAFCDADDQVGEGWVAAVHDALGTHEFVAGPFEVDLLNDRSRFSVSWAAQTTGLTVKPFLPQLVTAGSGNLGISKAVFEEVGGFFEGAHTAEDDDFCLRVQLAGHRLVYVPDLVLHVRQRSGLAHVYRQAFAYGRGARWLAHRYARVVEAVGAPPQVPGPGDEPTTAGPAEPGPTATTESVGLGARVARAADLARRALHKALRLTNPTDLADVTWRAGYTLGWSFGRIPECPQVDPNRPGLAPA